MLAGALVFTAGVWLTHAAMIMQTASEVPRSLDREGRFVVAGRRWPLVTDFAETQESLKGSAPGASTRS